MSVSFEQCFPSQQPTKCVQQCTVSRSASMCSSQTVAGSCFIESTSDLKVATAHLFNQTSEQTEDIRGFSKCYYEASAPQAQQLESWLEVTGPVSTYMTCADMIRHHKASEQPAQQQQPQQSHLVASAPSAGSAALDAACLCVDGGSRMVVVSWLVEVSEEFGLQQESLHAAVALLDRFLASAGGVPRCVLQLLAVGCLFIATKQLEVRPPSVEQLVSVAAHSFSAADLLRVERLLLDALDFKLAAPTAYGFLHLLTQATLAAMSMATTSQQQQQQPSAHPAAAAAAAAAAACCGPCSAMDAVVSLAMYLTELALLDAACCSLPGSTLATAALLLAHATLAGHCGGWQLLLTAAGMSAEQVQPAVAALRALHAAAAAPASAQLAELLLPLKAKFGQDCWCRVATDVTPIDMQQQQAENTYNC